MLASYDNLGGFAESRAWMDGDQWLIRGAEERLAGTVTGARERRASGDWVRWMEVRLVRL